jgi:hypothetical protein
VISLVVEVISLVVVVEVISLMVAVEVVSGSQV